MKKQTIAVLMFSAMQLVQGVAFASTGHERALNGAVANTRNTTRQFRVRRVSLLAAGSRAIRGAMRTGRMASGAHGIVAAEVGQQSLDAVAMGSVGTIAQSRESTQHSAGGLQASAVFSGNKVYLTPNAHEPAVREHEVAMNTSGKLTEEFARIAQGIAGHAANAKSPAQREHLTQAAIAAGQAQQIFQGMALLHQDMRNAHKFALDAAGRGDSTGALNATNVVMSKWGQLSDAIGKANQALTQFHGHIADATRPGHYGG